MSCTKEIGRIVNVSQFKGVIKNDISVKGKVVEKKKYVGKLTDYCVIIIDDTDGFAYDLNFDL